MIRKLLCCTVLVLAACGGRNDTHTDGDVTWSYDQGTNQITCEKADGVWAYDNEMHCEWLCVHYGGSVQPLHVELAFPEPVSDKTEPTIVQSGPGYCN